MSNPANGTTVMRAIAEQEDRFLKLDGANGKLLDFRQECLFAHQQITKNNYTMSVAQENIGSLKAAIMNVAAIGISLNPALQHAYLVPRDKRICLDISFRGLVKLATDSGAITWAKAELVFEGDTFAYRGPSTAPRHEADVFGDRGALKGGYVIAKLPDGEVLIDVMSVAEINKVRDTSKAKDKGPWVEWYHEMCKKTLIKRAYKSWPQTDGRQRLDQAVAVLNEHEGIAPPDDDPEMSAEEESLLSDLEKAAIGGFQALRDAFAAFPATDAKARVWKAHSARLKAIAEGSPRGEGDSDAPGQP